MRNLQILRDMMNSHISKINQALSTKLETIFNALVEGIQKKDTKVKALSKKSDMYSKQIDKTYTARDILMEEYERAKTKLDKQRTALNQKRSEIIDQISDLTRVDRENIPEEISPFSSRSDLKIAEVQAWQELKDSPEAKNYKNFRKIKTDLQNLLPLAISPKEQRDIILKFLSKDWQSLDIDLPPVLDVGEFNIQNGLITTNLLPQGK